MYIYVCVCIYIYIDGKWNTTQYKKEWNFAICNNMDDMEGIILSKVSQGKANTIWFILNVEFKN